MPESAYYAYVQAIQGDYEEALKQAEAGMIATISPAAYLLALGAKTLSLIGLGRFGEVLRIVRTGRELAEKNGEDPWLFIFREACLRALCFDFEGVHELGKTIMSKDAEHHAAEPRAIAMISFGYATLCQGRFADALQAFANVRDPAITPGFFLHWHWRMHARLGLSETWLQAGDIPHARIEVDEFLKSALSTDEPNMQTLAWETKARVAWAEKDREGTRKHIESALAILNRYEIPVSAWRVHATAWDFYSYVGEKEKAEWNRTRAREVIMRLADSFEPEEPLRASLMAVAPVQRLFADAVSA
jgi:tetratricopeptide (TPR) repeat protein